MFSHSIFSISKEKQRYSVDSEKNVHRFSYSNNGTWHWSGSTGDQKNPLDRQEISNRDVPEDFESSYIYKASTESIDDFGSSVFAVSYDDIVRIIGAKRRILRYDNNGCGYWEDIPKPDFYETKLYKYEVKEIIANIKKYYMSL